MRATRPPTERAVRWGAGILFLAVGVLAFATGPAGAVAPEVSRSVVSVLPTWPGQPEGGAPRVPPGTAPEGSAVAIRAGGYLVTALHVVARATAIAVRLPGGRLAPAVLVGRDPATDLAVLKVAADLPVLADAPGEPALGAPVCALGNQFGLGLSLTCGVVSAVHRTGVGFNPIEDFVQTDATVNPGASGGALIDGENRLVGILSAIFTKESDASIGVNFAVSIALARRVAADLIDLGRVRRAPSGVRVRDLERAEQKAHVGARVVALVPGGAGERAGLAIGDLIMRVGVRPIHRASDVTGAFALRRPGDTVRLTVLRDGADVPVKLVLPD